MLSDICYFIRKYYKLCFIYFIFLGSFFIVLDNKEMHDYILDHVFALDINIMSTDIGLTSLVIFNYLFYMYLSIILFMKDYDAFDNYFVRINFRKWYIFKILVNLLVIIVFHIILYIITMLFSNYVPLSIIIIIKKILFIIGIIIYIYLIMYQIDKNRLLASLLIPFSIIFLFHIEIRKISIYVILIVDLILLLITILSLRKSKFSDLEKELGDL